MADAIFIQHRFERVGPAGERFSDAITLPASEYALLDGPTLENMKEARFQEWQAVVAADRLRPTPVGIGRIRDLELQRARLQDELSLLDAEIDEIRRR